VVPFSAAILVPFSAVTDTRYATLAILDRRIGKTKRVGQIGISHKSVLCKPAGDEGRLLEPAGMGLHRVSRYNRADRTVQFNREGKTCAANGAFADYVTSSLCKLSRSPEPEYRTHCHTIRSAMG